MLKEILGTDPQLFLAQLVFALIGVAISLLVHAVDRDVKEPSTPNHFSMQFLIRDNWKRLVLNILVIFVSLRFFEDLTGLHISYMLCVAVGFSYDKLIQLIKSKTSFLNVPRK
jgi:hypothetical protein